MGNARPATLAATTVIAWLVMASPAAAHTPDIKVECGASGTVLSVSLQGYGNVRNTVKVQDGFTTLENREFGRSFVGSFPRAGDVTHTFTVTVVAADDDRFSFQKQIKAAVCVIPTPPPPPPPPAPAPLPPPPPAEPAPAPTTATPVPTVSSTGSAPTPTSTPSVPIATTTSIMQLSSGANLPGTGASIAIPLLVGLCLISAGGLFLFNRRKRRHAK
jgi:LPXTG-motif cell wall-anchored protein